MGYWHVENSETFWVSGYKQTQLLKNDSLTPPSSTYAGRPLWDTVENRLRWVYIVWESLSWRERTLCANQCLPSFECSSGCEAHFINISILEQFSNHYLCVSDWTDTLNLWREWVIAIVKFVECYSLSVVGRRDASSYWSNIPQVSTAIISTWIFKLLSMWNFGCEAWVSSVYLP